jgi:hypothetical protein
MALLARAGWAADKVQSDYGEDIVAQLAIGSRVTPVRIYIQVKGTCRLVERPSAGVYVTPPLATATVVRWLQMTDPVVLVLWDTTQQTGIYAHVRDVIDASVLEVSRPHVRLRLPVATVRTGDCVARIGWEALMQWCSHRCHAAHGRAELPLPRTLSGMRGKYRSASALERADAALVLLTCAGIIIEKPAAKRKDYKLEPTWAMAVTKCVVRRLVAVTRAKASMRKGECNNSKRIRELVRFEMGKCVIVQLMRRLNEVTQVPVLYNVLYEAACVASVLLRSMEADVIDVFPRIRALAASSDRD